MCKLKLFHWQRSLLVTDVEKLVSQNSFFPNINSGNKFTIIDKLKKI
ncbi:MAG: hypothetical protein RMZ41_008770 [Nostoc sp. DedVER02]|nr:MULTISPECIES: hypothetical protein [unclassified Nostoc]MDZ7990392.1 hypothetical protein [Nostoc sp. DedVER02]MDZ8115916.1 hypothetical protein [Nostoc sp. DedVER01b]